jgi:RNA polymerase sigma-70 factor, ECF subfamily
MRMNLLVGRSRLSGVTDHTGLDAALVAKAQSGDRDAFEIIVRTRLESCFATCLAVVSSPDDARDATQEAFVAAWRRLPGLRDPERFDGWLRQIALNVSRDLVRRRRRLREIPVSDLLAGPGQQAIEARIDVEAAIGRLPRERRLVAERHYLQDQPIKQISTEMGLPLGTVKSRLFYARRALQRILAKE